MSCSINDLDTGDILLFSPSIKDDGIFMKVLDWIIQTATHSPYTHVAFVLKNPEFIHPVLKGLYIWESSYEGTPDPQDGKIKFGVPKTVPAQLSVAVGEKGSAIWHSPSNSDNNAKSATGAMASFIMNVCVSIDAFPQSSLNSQERVIVSGLDRPSETSPK